MDCTKLLWKRRVKKMCQRFPMTYRIGWQVIAHRVSERRQHIGAFGRHNFDGRSRQGRDPPLGHTGGILAVGAEFTIRFGCSFRDVAVKMKGRFGFENQKRGQREETRQNESFRESWKRLKGNVCVYVTSSTATATSTGNTTTSIASTTTIST